MTYSHRHDDRDRPLRLLPPRLVPLSAEQERRAVDALAGLLASLLARQEAVWDRPSPGGASTTADRDDPPAA